jgi:hypothetical protein
MCLQIYDPDSGDYWADQPAITGLAFEPGFVWHVSVQPADSSSPSAWIATQIISRDQAAGKMSVTSPLLGDAFRSGSLLRGAVTLAPSDGRFFYRVYDAGGRLIGEGPIAVTTAEAGSGSFEGVIQFAEYEGPGRIEILDLYSPAGFIGESTSVDIYLGMELPPVSRPSAQVLGSRSLSIDWPSRYSISPPTLEIRGRVSISPFENTLGYHVFGADGRLLSEGSLMVQAELGQPGTFAGPVTIPLSYRGPARLVIFEASAADGLMVTSATLDLYLAGGSLP